MLSLSSSEIMFNLIAVLSTALLCALDHGQSAASSDDEFRLPVQTEPLTYALQFAPNLSDWTFTGVANITIKTNEITKTVTLNLKDLNVTGVSVSNAQSDEQVPVTKYVYLTENEQMEIHLNDSIPDEKKLLLTISYTGRIRDDFTGLYKDWYDNGVNKLSATNFEPTYARRTFPCYDEPKYKAKFNISVVMKVGLTALSNMPILSSTEDSTDKTIVYFRETPPMPTYLVAIYVGEIDPFKSGKVISNNYSPTKMNLLAITDLKAIATGNSVFNFARQISHRLSKNVKTSFQIRLHEAKDRELMREWLSNRVTCKWWDYLWLNEGLARYFYYFNVSGNTNLTTELFVVNEFQTALAYDQTPRHPITTSVKTPKEILSLFDIIPSSKAASVLRMLKNLMTEDVFEKSIDRYLKKDYQNYVTEPSNLFDAFESVLYEEDLNWPVTKFMSNWTLQPGYPVLNITRNTTTNTFLVTQSQFYIDKTDRIINKTAAWDIGLTFTTDLSKNFNDTNPIVWTNNESASTHIMPNMTEPRDIKWYIFNIQSIGFYRVNYEFDNWMALIKQLNDTPTDIHVLNRAQLIDDAFNLARSGQLNYSVPLRLSEYLKKENNTTPWYSAMNGFAYLLERMPRSVEGYANFKSYVSNLAGTMYEKMEFLVSNGNTEFEVLRAWETFSKWACRLENKYCTSKAQEYFDKWNTKNIKIPADIKDAAFCVGMKNSNGTSIFNKMFELYKKSESISERTSFEFAFGCSTNRTQLSMIINHIILEGPKGSNKENSIKSVVPAISATPLGLKVLYEFLSTKINKTLDQLSNGEEIVTYIYSTLASKMTQDSDIENIKNLMNNSTLQESIRTSFKKSYEVVEHNLAWFDSYSDGINKWTLEYEGKENKTNKSTTSSSETSNTYSSIVILQLMALSVLIKTYIL